MKRIFCLLSILLLASLAAFADIARPDVTPKKTPAPKKGVAVVTTMSIRLDKEATEAKLVIPKSQLKQLRAQLDDLDDSSDNTAALNGGFSRTQTIVSGMFLSLALVFGGMWFVRSGKAATNAGKTLIILAVIAGAGSAATLIYANVGPPPEVRTINGKMFSEQMHRYNYGSGQIRLETSNEIDTIQMIVPDKHETPSE